MTAYGSVTPLTYGQLFGTVPGFYGDLTGAETPTSPEEEPQHPGGAYVWLTTTQRLTTVRPRAVAWYRVVWPMRSRGHFTLGTPLPACGICSNDEQSLEDILRALQLID